MSQGVETRENTKTPITKAESKSNKKGERVNLVDGREGKAKRARPRGTGQRGPSTGAKTEQEGEGKETERKSYKKEMQGDGQVTQAL